MFGDKMRKSLTDRQFGRSSTKTIKGAAILLMLAHHLMDNPEKQWINMPEIYRLFPSIVGGMSIDRAVGSFGQICVSLFMFLGGYGLYKQMQDQSFSLFGKIKRLYITYWKYFIIFIPIGLAFFNKQSDYMVRSDFCHVFENINIKTLVACFWGWSFEINREWWFLRSFVFFSLLTYVYVKNTQHIDNIYVELLLLLVINIVLCGGFPALKNIEALAPLCNHKLMQIPNYYNNAACGCCSFMGAVIAKYGGMERIRYSLGVTGVIPEFFFSIVMLVSVFYMRLFVVDKTFDMFYCPVFTLTVWNLCGLIPVLRELLSVFGKYSTGIWLTHSLFLWYFEPTCKFIFAFSSIWIGYLILIIISLIAAILVEKFYYGLKCAIHSLHQDFI